MRAAVLRIAVWLAAGAGVIALGVALQSAAAGTIVVVLALWLNACALLYAEIDVRVLRAVSLGPDPAVQDAIRTAERAAAVSFPCVIVVRGGVASEPCELRWRAGGRSCLVLWDNASTLMPRDELTSVLTQAAMLLRGRHMRWRILTMGLGLAAIVAVPMMVAAYVPMPVRSAPVVAAIGACAAITLGLVLQALANHQYALVSRAAAERLGRGAGMQIGDRRTPARHGMIARGAVWVPTRLFSYRPSAVR